MTRTTIEPISTLPVKVATDESSNNYQVTSETATRDVENLHRASGNYFETNARCPHKIFLRFSNARIITHVYMNLHRSDQSYCPKVVRVHPVLASGESQPALEYKLAHRTGWFVLPTGTSESVTEVTLTVVKNHSNGRDCRIRCIRVHCELDTSKPLEAVLLTASGVSFSAIHPDTGSVPTDCTLAMADGELNAHKAVLMAASEYFRAMLVSGMLESGGRVSLPDIPTETMRAVIDFIYLGTLELNCGKDDVFEIQTPQGETLLFTGPVGFTLNLFVVAQRLALGGLCGSIASWMVQSISLLAQTDSFVGFITAFTDSHLDKVCSAYLLLNPIAALYDGTLDRMGDGVLRTFVSKLIGTEAVQQFNMPEIGSRVGVLPAVRIPSDAAKPFSGVLLGRTSTKPDGMACIEYKTVSGGTAEWSVLAMAVAAIIEDDA
ncbi:Anaphase-promoting complex, subunit 10 (APC10) [Carpediemonas membranifera]|uniref:Anaphase-promoting complex, subunit 10 (APC10) n=1 Tax=Carpediemonas membranifera TaxID=201153 RepID=A0A8J6EAB5_9EUKA|nr:Anaphase-promoting complex, subunit 10 (APC10) [Carpediemonas membranifera]|eukprot:KAG9394465.1 Anaphase-promoting complex, subunit 10 (APC10) [Carpediemonas membranifera]